MQLRSVAALAAMISASLRGQTIADLSAAAPIPGDWGYGATTIGSEAQFRDTSATPQLIISCDRAIRRVTISKPASGPTPYLNIWTSSQSRSIAASFNPAVGRLTVELASNDSLLDSLSSSRGRIGVSAGSLPPLIAPAWPELARVIEDCRS